MKNYVLCTTLESSSIETLKNLRKDIDLKHAKIHIVRVVEIQVYSSESVTMVYPTEAEYKEIEKLSIQKMREIANSLSVNEENLIMHCFFDFNRENKIKKYLEETKADLVVVATRGKHGIAGLFSSSFADFLCKFSPCDVLVMRPKA
jgi:nucleotide-binding universal stress UspA family protein